MLPMPVRIKFTKTGSLQFISHLDLNRTMKSVMIRAGIAVHYSEGFNPHPKITFGLPLSIGAQSFCELMDFKSDIEMPYSEIAERLNRALPDEMRVLEAYCPEKPLSDICYAEYEIISSAPVSAEALGQEHIFVMKRTKSGTNETDIRPLIKSFSAESNKCTCVLSASPDSYLNPEYIASVIGASDYDIIRINMLDKKMRTFR